MTICNNIHVSVRTCISLQFWMSYVLSLCNAFYEKIKINLVFCSSSLFAFIYVFIYFCCRLITLRAAALFFVIEAVNNTFGNSLVDKHREKHTKSKQTRLLFFKCNRVMLMFTHLLVGCCKPQLQHDWLYIYRHWSWKDLIALIV